MIRTIYKLKNIRDRSFFREWGAGGIKGGSPKEKWLQGGGAQEKFSQSCIKLSWIGGGSPQIV